MATAAETKGVLRSVGTPLLGGKEAFLGIRRGATQMLSLLAGRMFVAELGLSGGL